MTLVNTTTIALKALRRNPSRALLTTLGIVIGIAAVITMTEITGGSSVSIRQSIEKMGANSAMVMPGGRRFGGVSLGTGTVMSLTPDDAEAIGRECASVALVSPVVRAGSMQVIFGNKNWVPSTMSGVNENYFEISNWQLEEGRFFDSDDVERNATVCVVGSTIVREVFGGLSPIDCELRIKNVSFRVIGVLKSKGANMMGMDEDDVIFAPWTTIRMRITGRKSGTASHTTSSAASTPGELYSATGVAFYPEQDSSLATDKLLVPKFTQIDQISFSASSPEKVPAAIAEVNALLRERHHLRDDQDDDFRVHNFSDFMKMLDSTSTLMTNLLLGVALISLVVGGVGIMNIMLVSVTERTREIGLRMAVGARSRDILKQFLIESIVLCLSGGVIGIVVGHGCGLIFKYYMKWPVQSNPSAVIAAVGVSAAVGILFGFYPAWKASKLDPIEALRYE